MSGTKTITIAKELENIKYIVTSILELIDGIVKLNNSSDLNPARVVKLVHKSLFQQLKNLFHYELIISEYNIKTYLPALIFVKPINNNKFDISNLTLDTNEKIKTLLKLLNTNQIPITTLVNNIILTSNKFAHTIKIGNNLIVSFRFNLHVKMTEKYFNSHDNNGNDNTVLFNRPLEDMFKHYINSYTESIDIFREFINNVIGENLFDKSEDIKRSLKLDKNTNILTINPITRESIHKSTKTNKKYNYAYISSGINSSQTDNTCIYIEESHSVFSDECLDITPTNYQFRLSVSDIKNLVENLNAKINKAILSEHILKTLNNLIREYISISPNKEYYSNRYNIYTLDGTTIIVKLPTLLIDNIKNHCIMSNELNLVFHIV